MNAQIAAWEKAILEELARENALKTEENTVANVNQKEAIHTMKLRIQNTGYIGDPEIGGELEIQTHGRIYDIEIVKEKMSLQGVDFGTRPSLIKATTTSADNYKSWEVLGSIGVDSGMAGIWDADAPDGTKWFEGDQIYLSNRDGDFFDGVITDSGTGDGRYNVYVKRENGEITDFVIDFHDY